MTNDELERILGLHKKWRHGESDGARAILCEANLYDADLREADLRGADLRDADLRGADLLGANLYGADLRLAEGIDHLIFARALGSRKDETQWDFKNDWVICGCFRGTMAEFRAQVEETHRDNPVYLAEYRAMIQFFEAVKAAREQGNVAVSNTDEH
jgi:hypothetical protein